MRLKFAIAFCLPFGPGCFGSSIVQRKDAEPEASEVRACRAKGELCSTSADCCRGLGLICLQLPVAGQAGDPVADIGQNITSGDPLPLRSAAVRSEKRCACYHGFPSTKDGRGCQTLKCVTGGSYCDANFKCCPGYKCGVFYPYCVHNTSDLRFESAHGDFGGPGAANRVYLSNFSAVSFLVVKLILKIFVIIACCALLQDCFRRKRRVASVPGTLGAADAFDILPLRRRTLGGACSTPPRRFRRTQPGSDLSSNSSSGGATPNRRRRSHSRERRCPRSASRDRRAVQQSRAGLVGVEADEPPPSYDEVIAPPPTYEVTMQQQGAFGSAHQPRDMV